MTGIAVDPNDPGRVFASTPAMPACSAPSTLETYMAGRWAVPPTFRSLPWPPIRPTPGSFFPGRGAISAVPTGATPGECGGRRRSPRIEDRRFVSSIPTNAGVVYAADVGSGVYRSNDTGISWEAINNGLRTRAVNDLAISGDGRRSLRRYRG